MNFDPIIDALRQKAMQNQTPVGELSTTPDQPLAQYGLDSVDCPVCGNTGTVWGEDEDGARWARECECMAQRRSIKRIRRSGLEELMQRYTFDSYETEDEKHVSIKNAALRFCEDDTNAWFFIAGKPGSGKTHICTAICGELLKKQEVRYMVWRDEIVQIKANVTDADRYEEALRPFKRVPVLYIDDFLKGKVTEADLNAAFEIINARYNDAGKRTIISSERPMPEILSLDEAIGSRIYERSRGFMVQPPDENRRLRP